MIMKRFYACLILLFFTVMPAFAQDQPSSDGHQPPSVEDIVAKLQSKLNLTQDQVTAVTPIIEKYSSKRQDLRQSMEDGTADKDTIRSQMKQLKADQTQELSQVLSSDQLNQWEQMQNQGWHKHNSDDGGNREGGEEGGGNGGDSGSGE
jgi:uncharacterized protein (DUF2235 family)